MTDDPERTRLSVVVVDDSPEVRGLVRRRLQSSGMFDVVGEGADGEEAISLVHRHEPALLLLDTSMPTMDGIEALPAILAVSPETRVVMFTGFEEPGLAARARELGAVDFIEKSIPLELLPERLLLALSKAPPWPPGARPRLSVVGGALGDEQSALAREQLILDEHIGQFRELFDQAAIGMATLTVNGTIVRANRALAALMSCSPYDLVGVDYGRLTEGAGAKFDRGLEAIGVAGEDLTTFEHDLPRFVGETSRQVRVTLAPIRDSDQQVLYVFAQVQDITAQRDAEEHLRRSEEVFRLLVRAVGEYALFMLDVEGNVISWNAGAARIKGYAANEIVGRHFRVFYLPEDQASGHPERNLRAALRDDGFMEDGWRVRKDGSRFWASVVISPVYDDAGVHVGFAKVTRDQTESRLHEEERKKAVTQQAHLLAVTAHELRTPTAVVDGSAGTLQESWDRMSVADREELLDGIRTSAHRLRRLASDLATASQLHGGEAQLRSEEVSLTQLLRSAAARMEAAEPGVHVTVAIPEEISMYGDPERLAQALDNLLDNAVRHGAPPIDLLGEAAGDAVHIRVRDAGLGVPNSMVPRLFERFSTGGRSGGTGLGLYLVDEIARRHGGEAHYHPPGPDRQVEFEMTLPTRA